MKLTIGNKITALAVCLVALALMQGGLALWNLRALDADILGFTDDTLPGLHYIGAISSDLASYRGDIFHHILASDEKNWAEVEQRQEAMQKQLAQDMASYEKYALQPEDRENFKALRQNQNVFLDSWQNTVRPLSRKRQTQRALRQYNEQLLPRFNEQMALVNRMRDGNWQAGLTTGKSATTNSASAQFWTKLLLPGMVLIGAALSWFIVRGVNQDLRGIVRELTLGGDQVAFAAGQISGSSQSLSEGASEQAASLEEISASVEQMAAMTKRNAENSSQAMGMMLETAAQVERSNTALQAMVASMSSIKESSERVGKINKTIDEIAFQTNILALNAAVEAARAGSAGMGFAVVAGEVRNLAQRSAVAAKDTAVLIEQAVANSSEGAEKLEHVAEAIRAITEGAAHVKNLVDEVNEASRQQAQGIEQVAKAITQINGVTQNNAASAEESAAASQQMTAQSQEMLRLMSALREMVEGAHSAAAKPAAGRSAKAPVSAMAKRPFLAPKPQPAASAAAGGAKGSSSTKTGSAQPTRSAVLVAEEEFPMESDPEGGFSSF